MVNNKNKKRISFSRIPSIIEYPNLMDIQLKSFEQFLQEHVQPAERKSEGLQTVFENIFPITDSRGNYELQFVEYYLDKPKYDVRECQERGVTYAVPLKAKMRLAIKDVTGETENFTEFIEQDVYLGNMPYMTARGTFVINGAERVIVSQLHRSPGVFFSQSEHPNGTPLYSARIIPFRGSWIEFTTDVTDIMYVYIDRKKKFPVTMLLRAINYSTDEDIINLFDLSESIELNKDGISLSIGRTLAKDIINTETGEIVAEQGFTVDEEILSLCKKNKIKVIDVILAVDPSSPNVILNTIKKDVTKSEEQAVEAIYRQLRSGEPPDIDTARSLIERMFFNNKRYDMGAVGRYRINKKLNVSTPYDVTILTPEDIVSEVKDRIEVFGPGGGFIISPAHNIQVNPRSIDNTFIYYWACNKYGRY